MSITIIIGTSAAGLAAANKLRDLDPLAEIICLTKESSMPYNRCLLADFLGGSRTKEQVHTKTQPFFAEKNIDLQLDVEVTGLDVVAKKIILRSGSMLAYDNLIIATGRSAFVPTPIDVSLPGIFPFYDLDHATDILSYQAATKARRVLVIGAGITGLECTDALHQRGLEVTVVERSAQVLARQIDNDGALFLQDLMERKGITLHLGTTVASVETLQVRNQPAYRVTLGNGKVIEVDKIIAATGGRQNLGFAQAAGITCDQFGIVTDESQATNIPNVFAAGDVCSIINLASGKRTFSTLWPDAVAQGLTAANSIVGLCKPFTGTLNITSTNIFDITLVTCGDFSATNGLDILSKSAPDFYHRFYLNDGILQAFVMVGNVGSVGQLRKAILEKTRIG